MHLDVVVVLLGLTGPLFAAATGVVLFEPRPEWKIPASWYGQEHGLQYGAAILQGVRSEQEDRFSVNCSLPNHPEAALFSVYDGHVGQKASDFARFYLPIAVDRHLSQMKPIDGRHGDLQQRKEGDAVQRALQGVLHDAFLEADREFLTLAKEGQWQDGSTITAALVVNGHVVVANAGDSRGVLYRQGEAVALSRDHKPNRLDEKKRITKMGGSVVHDGVWRVQGVLATSRSIGNLALKRFIIPDPEFADASLREKDSFLILASDGLWDVLSSQEAVLLTHEFRRSRDLGAKQLAVEALKRGSTDNITVVIVRAIGPPHLSHTATCRNDHDFFHYVRETCRPKCRVHMEARAIMGEEVEGVGGGKL
eukprot:comp18968_c0_seq1/m.21260 comp18968_c0_seq1/g.21260  ORF comp18968_c0_seq1/g.21260 comp18968_c0_seq1/m.21260 type:complete len:366 (-) comp18968_c0_seq1:608-1705(-)